MMNLDEILRGIGSQMSRSIPQWDSQGLQPQVQSPDLGIFGNFMADRFPAPDNTFGDYGIFRGSNYSLFPAQKTADALSHVQAATAPLQAPTKPTAPGTPAVNDQEVEQYIRQAAQGRGINPDTAVKVWGGEGRSSYAGDNGSSFGPYQLHYGQVAAGGNSVGGLGDTFTKQTGLDARDPSTWQAQVNFALDNVKSGGWTPWHGAAAQGVGPWEGIGSPSQSAPGAAESQTIMDKVKPFLNQPYVWGGKSPNAGFDCSGLAGYLTTGQPESTVSLYGKSTPLAEQQAQPGDLVFYNMNQSDMHIQHVAVYLGNGQIVQSGGTENKVNVGEAHQAVGSAPEFRRVSGG